MLVVIAAARARCSFACFASSSFLICTTMTAIFFNEGVEFLAVPELRKNFVSRWWCALVEKAHFNGGGLEIALRNHQANEIARRVSINISIFVVLL